MHWMAGVSGGRISRVAGGNGLSVDGRAAGTNSADQVLAAVLVAFALFTAAQAGLALFLFRLAVRGLASAAGGAVELEDAAS